MIHIRGVNAMAAAVVNKRSSFQPSCTICQSDGQSEVLSRPEDVLNRKSRVDIDGRPHYSPGWYRRGFTLRVESLPKHGWLGQSTATGTANCQLWRRRSGMLASPRLMLEEQSRIITLSVDNGGLWPSRKTLAKRHVLGGKVSRVSKHLARKEFNERLDATTLNDQVEASIKLLLPNWDWVKVARYVRKHRKWWKVIES